MENNAVPHSTESTLTRGAWLRLRFRLRTLLLLPVVAAALLLVAFPKLLTGDFVEATVVSIEENADRVRIQLDARISSGTLWRATIFPKGAFGGLGVSGNSQPHWTRLIPTWPKHETLLLNLRRRDKSLAAASDPMLTIRQGETYRVTPRQPLDVARDSCQMKVPRGSRLGL
jgi:hypothetical protein